MSQKSCEDNKKPLRAFAIINKRGELARIYHGNKDEPWKIQLPSCDNRFVSMLLEGDTVIELKPETPIDVKY